MIFLDEAEILITHLITGTLLSFKLIFKFDEY